MAKSLFLNCLHCGYDLTGLTEERCPECGQSFATADIQAIEEHHQALAGSTLGNFLRFPMFLTLLGVGNGLIFETVYEDVGLIFISTIAVIVVVYGIVESIKLANRFAWQRAIRTEGRHPFKRSTPFVVVIVTGLICCQSFLSIAGYYGGCACVVINRNDVRLQL